MASRRTWEEPGRHLAVYMGESPEDAMAEPEPIEPNDEGCPGGWYRTPFFASVSRYLRPVAEGVYSPNLTLERTRDRLVIEAVKYYEHEQSRHRRWCSELVSKQIASRTR